MTRYGRISLFRHGKSAPRIKVIQRKAGNDIIRRRCRRNNAGLTARHAGGTSRISLPCKESDGTNKAIDCYRRRLLTNSRYELSACQRCLRGHIVLQAATFPERHNDFLSKTVWVRLQHITLAGVIRKCNSVCFIFIWASKNVTQRQRYHCAMFTNHVSTALFITGILGVLNGHQVVDIQIFDPLA